MSQNINIQYKVDSSQVAQSTAAVNQAKAATDQLNASAQKLGQAGTKSNIQFGNTIEGVRLKMQQLKGQIDLTNQTDTKRLNGLITQYKAAQAQLDKYNSALKTSNKEGVSGTNSLTSSFGGLYNAIKLVIGAQVVKQFVSMSIEAAALSGKVEGIERAFNHAFPNAVLILSDLRKATHGTVVDFELMQRTLQATNLGVSVEKLPILFEFAAARAQQTGESVEFLVDSIVRGIGRKSILVLDNLGLSATRLKEQFHGASLQSQSVGDVTAAVAEIARQELAKMGGYIETNATRVDQLKASWTGLGVEISKLAAQKGGVIEFFKGYTNALSALIEATNKGITVTELFRDRRIKEAAIEGVNFIKQKEFTGQKEHDLQITKEIIAEKTHDLIQQQEELKLLEQKRLALLKNESIRGGIGKKNLAAQKEQEQLVTQNKVLIEQIKILKGLEAELSKKDSIDTDTLKVLEARVSSLNEKIKDTENISTRVGIAEARRLKDQVNATEEKIEAIKKEIFWEEILQKRRESIQPQKLEDIKLDKQSTSFGVQVNFDKDKIKEDFLSTTSQALKDGTVILSKELEQGLPIVLPAPIIHEDGWSKLADSFIRHYQQIVDSVLGITNNLAQSQLNQAVTSLDAQIQATQDFYNNQINLAGDNEKAKDKLRTEEAKKIKLLQKQRADAEKKAALGGIIVNTALGIIKAIATAVSIYDGIAESVIVAGEGASQYAIASNARYYAKGEIDIKGGKPGKDSIPAMLMPRESIMTSQETMSSGRTLRMIRAKKLNDKVLDRIMANVNSGSSVVGFDDTRLLAATKQVARAAAGNDIVRKGSHIYEAKREGEKMKIYIRSKSLN